MQDPPRPVEPVVAPPPGNPRFPLVDSVRAIAALSVLVTHTAFLSGANQYGSYGRYTARLDVGVAIFFVISGFLLYRPFVSARIDGRRGPRVRDYARRRVLRIYPAYWLALTVLAIYPGLAGVWSDHWAVYYLLLQNYFGTWITGGIGATWSLCVEVSFYVFLPLLAWGMLHLLPRRTREQRIRTELVMLAVLAAIGIVVRALTTGAYGHNTLPGNLDWFALGMLVAVASAAWGADAVGPAPVRALRRVPAIAWLAALFVFWVVSTQLGLPHGLPANVPIEQDLGEHILYGAIGFLIILPAVFGADGGGLVRKILANRVLAWLGLVSYGIFLWHQPLLLVFWRAHDYSLFENYRFAYTTLATFGAALICATISYYALERPILRYKDGRRRVRARERAGPAATEASGIAG
jgi:peptidoglycan/LPS O-acetylase OafA/YrhL